MKISDVSIRNPVFAWMLMLGLITFGVISFSRLGVSQLPDVDFPVLNVSVNLPGAAPEVVETTLVDVLENALSTVEGVRSITSSSKTGQANVSLEFELEKNIDVALQEVQTKISQAQRLLPEDMDPPTISKTNPDDQPILWLALTYEKDDPLFMMKYARDYLRDRFVSVPGVGDVFLGGYTDPALRVWVKPEMLTKHYISVTDIIDAINSEHAELPGGFIETDKVNFNVRTMGEAKTVEEFGNIVISNRGGRKVSDPSQMLRLKQVARVEEGLDEVTRISRFNGQPALGLGIRKQRGTNSVAVAKAVRAKVEEIRSQLPPGMDIKVNNDSTRFVQASINELQMHLMIAALLTSLVCWIFLGSFSATINVLLAIPTSIFGAFIGLYFFGFTLNTFTLLGLTLAIGIVVDDAIMVLENIFRYNEKGKSRIVSAILGSREIAFPALAATVAVVAIFLPVAFMKGAIGKYFMQFGVTISLAVLLSLLEALTITPMRSARFLSKNERTTAAGKWFERQMKNLEEAYRKFLIGSLRRPWTVLTLSILFVAASFVCVKYIKKEFLPVQDQSMFMARVSMPVGTSLKYTDEQTKKAEEWLLKQPEIQGLYVAVGGFSGGASDAHTAIMFVTLKPKKERSVSQQDFMERARTELKKIENAKFSLQDLSARGFGGRGRGYAIEFSVLGPNWEKLAGQAQAIMKEMEDSGQFVDLDSNYLVGLPEIQMRPDRIRAALHGVSIRSIGKTVNSLIGGEKVGQYAQDGRRYDVRLQVEKTMDPKAGLDRLLIANSQGNLISISEVVNKVDGKSLQSISRENRQRSITVYANLPKTVSADLGMKKVREISQKILEPGYMIGESGSSKNMSESFSGLGFALVMGLLVAYMVLASQFKSFIDPVTVLMALPFSISGAFFALLLTSQSFNIYSMIGILLLMGIVKKNSILLVEFTNVVRERNHGTALGSLIEACPIRLRPILMTSIATMAGALPSALAWGEGAEAFRPMAVTIIGGVFVSTVLTLIVIPCFYLIVDRFRTSHRDQEELSSAFKEVESHP